MIPGLLVLTDRHLAAAAGRDLPTTVHLAAEGGAPAVLLREKDLPPAERLWLGRQVQDACGDAALYVSSDPDLARELGAAGVHLAALDPWPPDAVDLVRGRSCHDARERAVAGEQGADYVTLSPVFATPSKPGYGPPLGLCGLAEVAATSGPPVLALGGITATTAGGCWEAGAAGVAVMGSVMGAADPAAIVRALLRALEVPAP